MKKKGFATRQIHAGMEKNAFGSLSLPIFQTSTFAFDNAAQGGARFALEEDGFVYTRLGNPTTNAVERKVADLEGGAWALGCGSGMGAITSLVWSLLKAGDHIVAQKTLYGCTYSYFAHGLTRYGIEVDFVDARDIQNVADKIKDNTKMIYLETPANPNMYLTDIAGVKEIVGDREIDIVVDNTYMTPYLQQPLALGANYAIHSATKYINGHGDVVAGFIVGRDAETMENIRYFGLKDMTGAVLSPFDAYLINRGLKTLDIRMEKHCANAQKIAEYLEKHPKIESVAYPGLPSFPQYELAKKQMRLPGAMMAFEMKGGMEAGVKLMDNVKMLTLAVSLGDCETLIQHPASMTHSPYTPEERAASFITDGLVRLSVGLEDADDIIADLEQALERV